MRASSGDPVLEKLMDGNQRCITASSTHSNQTVERRRSVAKSQSREWLDQMHLS